METTENKKNGISNFINKVIKNKVFLIVVLIFVMLLSIFPVEKFVSNPESYSNTMSILNTKNENVMKITAGIAAFSIGVSFIPAAGDTISLQVSDLIKYLIAIIIIIYFEKYLLAISGYVSFRWLIPIACVLMIIYIFTRKNLFKNLATKFALFAMVLVLIVPISVHITNLIEKSNISVQNMLKTTEELKKLNEENIMNEMNIEGSSGANIEENSNVEEKIEEKLENGSLNPISKIFNTGKKVVEDGISKAKESIGSAISYTGEQVNRAKEFAVNKLRQLIEAVAIMLVTSCVIPIIVLLILISITKSLFAFDFTRYTKDFTGMLKKE